MQDETIEFNFEQFGSVANVFDIKRKNQPDKVGLEEDLILTTVAKGIQKNRGSDQIIKAGEKQEDQIDYYDKLELEKQKVIARNKEREKWKLMREMQENKVFQQKVEGLEELIGEDENKEQDLITH